MWIKVTLIGMSILIGDLIYMLQIEPQTVSIVNILIAGISAVTAGLIFLFLLYTKQNKEFQKALQESAERTEKIYQTTVIESHEQQAKTREVIIDFNNTLKQLPSELKRQLKD